MNPTDSESGTNLALKVASAQIRQVYAQTFLGLLSNLVLAVMVVVVLWPVISPVWLWGWFGLWFVVQSGRFILALKYRATNPSGVESLRWGRWQTIGVAMSGLVWGAAAIVLWPAESPLHQIFVPIVVVGLNAGATAGYAPLKLSYRLSLFLTLIPLSARFLYEGTTVHRLIGLTGILYLGTMYTIGKNLHRASTQALTIGFENEALVRKMEVLNQELQTQAEILQESEARFQGLAQATFETIIIHRQGHILDVNQAALQLIGLSGR